ncbi:Retrovirus-related Pol polyprotein, partial [Operophtera brumata]
MSSNYLASIPKLKGRENFDDWAFAVENLLILEGAEKYLKEEGTEAASVAADAKARAKLILTIDSSLFVHIKETKTSNQLWTKLRALFDDSGFSRRITLLRHLISIRSWQNKKQINKGGSTSKHGGPTSMSNSSNVKNTKTITCYRCKKMGHYRNQCPLLNEKTESKNESNAFSVVFLSGKFSKSDFYIDSGASMHMTANESWIKNPTYSSSLPQIIIANKTKVPVLCSGEVEITTSKNYNITVNNVLCVPSLTTNLLSVSELIKNGNSVVFEPHRCLIRNKLDQLVAEAELID